MNKLVCSALAIAVVGAHGFASEDDWLSLDQEIESLSASLSRQSTGPVLGGWVFASFRWSGDLNGASGVNQDAAAGSTPDDLTGIQMDQTRLFVEGSHDNFGYKVSADFFQPNGIPTGSTATGQGGGFNLLDAYASWKIGDTVTLTGGQFRQPFLRSGLIDQNRTFFFSDRTALGDAFAIRTPGLMVGGDHGTVRWWVSAQNDQRAAAAATDSAGGVGTAPGSPSGTGRGSLFSGRVAVDVAGGGVGMVEGAYGANPGTAATVGLSLASESGHNKGFHAVLDGQVTLNEKFYLAAEITTFDKGSDPDANGTFAYGNMWNQFSGIKAGAPTGGAWTPADVSKSTPWMIEGTWMITPDTWEVGIRYQDGDTALKDKVLNLGVNRYVKGHDIKWYLGYSNLDTNATEAVNGYKKTNIVTLGLGVSF